jgi:hypothetical protein
MQGWFNTCKLINTIWHTNIIKDKNHMIISIAAEKAFDKIHHQFMIRALKKIGIEVMYCNIMKDICDKLYATLH